MSSCCELTCSVDKSPELWSVSVFDLFIIYLFIYCVFDLKRSLFRSNLAKMQLSCVRILSSPHHGYHGGRGLKDAETATGRLRQSGYSPTSLGMSRMPARHYQIQEGFFLASSQQGPPNWHFVSAVGLQNCENSFCHFRCPVCGKFLWLSYEANTFQDFASFFSPCFSSLAVWSSQLHCPSVAFSWGSYVTASSGWGDVGRWPPAGVQCRDAYCWESSFPSSWVSGSLLAS